MNEKHIRILATVATIAAVCMYASYGFQIQSHLAGHKGNPIQPLCAAIN
jgi:integral membrane protein